MLHRLARPVLVSLAVAATASAAFAQSPTPLSVEVSGRGRPVVLIPGLASGGEVWAGTAADLSRDHEVHVLTLAGFGGRAPIAADSTWLVTMRDAVAAYVRERGLAKPVIVGHSLGGVLALWLAVESPELVSAIVNVDGLPFIGATVSPTATVESMRPQALQMRRMMRDTASARRFAQMQDAQVAMLVRDSSHHAMVRRMMRTSDAATVAEASYALWTIDLRPALARLSVPALSLHAWAGYKSFGMTRARADTLFGSQYSAAPRMQLRIHDAGHHFLMLDEPAWTLAEIRRFLADLER